MTREGHPDELLTASYVEGRLDGEARERFEAHLADCSVCRSGLALLALDAEEESPTLDDRELERFRQAALASAPHRFPGGKGTPWILAAAALMIVAFTAYRFGVPDAQPTSGVERSAGADASTLGDRFPAPGSLVDAAELRFRWSPVEGADRYVVEVRDATGRKLATLDAAASEPAVSWPVDRPAPRGTLFWTVRAMALDRVLDESRPIAFECR